MKTPLPVALACRLQSPLRPVPNVYNLSVENFLGKCDFDWGCQDFYKCHNRATMNGDLVMSTGKQTVKKAAKKGTFVKDSPKPAKSAAKRAAMRTRTVTTTSCLVNEQIVILETLERIGKRQLRSAQTVGEVSFGRIFADGVFSAE